MYGKSCGRKSCQTGHCLLEMLLTLSCKSPRYLTHQKIKEFYAQLYSWHFEAKNNDKSKVQDKEAIKIIIEEVEDSEVMGPKRKEKQKATANSRLG